MLPRRDGGYAFAMHQLGARLVADGERPFHLGPVEACKRPGKGSGTLVLDRGEEQA